VQGHGGNGALGHTRCHGAAHVVLRHAVHPPSASHGLLPADCLPIRRGSIGTRRARDAKHSLQQREDGGGLVACGGAMPVVMRFLMLATERWKN